MSPLDLRPLIDLAQQVPTFRFQGRVVRAVGLSLAVEGLSLPVGGLCFIYPGEGMPRITAEVIGFHEHQLILMPYDEMRGVRPGSPVVPAGRPFMVPVGDELLGRVIDGLGRPLDGKQNLGTRLLRPLGLPLTAPLERKPIHNVFVTGVRAIDGLLTLGEGQRIGIFAGSGVGKSTLLGMIARQARADVVVIALVGERGREVQEFVEHNLGPAGLQRSVVVVSTSDRPALQRIKAAWLATTIAEYFRDRGLHVALLMDSVTRFAMAQREVGLAAGEPPVSKGYTPSVYALLPGLLERAGTGQRGAITGLYTVLVEGDDQNDPIADTVRSILDGHIWLSRELAHERHFPAIDVLSSVSRLMSHLATPTQRDQASQVLEILALHRRMRDLIAVGAYTPGTQPDVDRVLRLLPRIDSFLRQESSEFSSWDATQSSLAATLVE
ncbi:MAG TPA: FliI/YscN family ATPase [Chloroflexota bacterium]|nr:FliI/YscN family ATPase [Chloroflexota bacterium]